MDVWDIYFATLVSFTLHPGYLKDEDRRPSLAECARMADQMYELRSIRQWHSDPSPPQ